jgi:hypothetical protein
MTEILVALLLFKVFEAVMFQVASYVENHTNFTTGPTRLKNAVSGALWWLA